MSDPIREQSTSELFGLLAGGDTSVFDVVLKRYNRDLVWKAKLYIRRIGMYEALYDGQEAVDDAVIAMCERARRGELQSLHGSVAFWRELLLELRTAVRKTAEHFNAQKRRAWSNGDEPPHRHDPDWNDPTPLEFGTVHETELQQLFSKAPPPEDLAHVKLEIEALLTSLEDPELQEILKMRIHEYTVEEIARKLDLSSRTLNRRIFQIRNQFKSRYQR